MAFQLIRKTGAPELLKWRIWTENVSDSNQMEEGFNFKTEATEAASMLPGKAGNSLVNLSHGHPLYFL